MNHIATKQGETYFKPQQLGRECDVYLSTRGKVSNDLMSRNPGSGVKTDGRDRGQTVGTWRQERNSSNVFVAETETNCVLWQNEGSVEANSQSQFVATGIHNFTDSINYINPNQYGFTRHLSTYHPLLRLTEKITSGFQRGRSTGAVFLDIQKAFDRVWTAETNSSPRPLSPSMSTNKETPSRKQANQHQVPNTLNQRDLQRIIWKHGLDAEILTYRLKTVTYGLSNASFLTIRTLQQLTKDEKSRFPLASETLLYDTYMDNIVSGAPDLETAQQLQSQLKDALQSCGMNLHKWSSNSNELLNSSLSSDVEHSFSTDIDLSVKTLGISWKPFEDCFVFKASVSAKHIYTKLEVLSVITKLYDPLGFLGPEIAKAKVFLQQLWQCKLDWDDVLPNSIANEWREFVTTLKGIEEAKINRFIMADNNVRTVLQGFADASEAAYGAVVYLQCFLHNGAAKVSILASKSRVAPIRVISIPRLELCVCVLLAQFVKKIRFTLSDGLLRVLGRLSNSDLPYVNKHPAILPGNHNLTVQIIAHFHRKNLHTGASSLLHYVKEKFWPLNGLSLCRKEVQECLVCFKSRPLVTSQLMGNLPRDSLVPDYLFNCSGVDFCGPFMIRYKNQRKGILHKIYICVFVCFVSKAIHIEIVSDLTSDAYCYIKRFFSRRSKCAKLYSDNGKTFVGANKKLKRFVKLIEDSDDNLAGFLSAEGIEWKFIPPRVPSFGGLWEASVKSIKYHLKRVISGSNLTYQEFLIVCIQIEGILNSRALCPLSSNSDDLNALTPAHFLIGRSMTSVVEPNLIELKENALKKWQRITRLVGDLVVLIEDKMPTFKWPLGRITEIYNDSDALIRVVKVKTQVGEYKKAISRVSLLPMPV
ncbi:integrase catalytic domain-containing protein [Trichonephila clavipes]|nr:integrase catalytic domain-containing protein [Trichonephila clavipes]